ncbi:MAG: transcriptional regulator [Proteobacteria bacterium SG_bin5]|nr:AbrB/MazE/SpoVT family DNA-binding domain-containing protein [Sphingomonas sp.]OQW41442.1 MAG: transcriptional regulator [Proteobacteria bacterium SG_bin5]
MNKPLKLIKIGNSTGVILPKEVLARLKVEQGEAVYLSEAPEGFRLTAHDPDFAEAMAAAEKIMREDRDILKVLAQ